MRTFWLIRAITSLIFRLCVPKADLHTPALKGGAHFYFRLRGVPHEKIEKTAQQSPTAAQVGMANLMMRRSW